VLEYPYKALPVGHLTHIARITQSLFTEITAVGAGVALLGEWFGTGPDRGIALVFIGAGLIGLIVTLFAFRSQSYRLLTEHFASSASKSL
jgi:DHA3 family multidrug efflux protein-like MFS transporter